MAEPQIFILVVAVIIYVAIGICVFMLTYHGDGDLSFALAVLWPIWGILFGAKYLYQGFGKAFKRLTK